MFWTPYPRDVVQVSGSDAATYLQSQLSQDIRQLSAGDSAWSFLLQPNGKIDVLLRVARTGEEVFVLDSDAGYGATMVARLNRFKIRVQVEIGELLWRCIAVRGDGVAAIGTDGLASWGGGVDLLGENPTPPASAEAGTADDLLSARIDAVWPAMGSEIKPGETIPGETGIAAAAVNFAKGCYPGQELVERMDSRGAAAPRLLQRVSVPSGTAVGDAYIVDGISVGVVTSVQGDAALAMVKRGAVPR